MDNIRYRPFATEFRKGDKLFLFTDGLFEEFNSGKEEFGEERLYRLLREFRREPVDSAVSRILGKLDEFLNEVGKQDDITVLAFEHL